MSEQLLIADASPLIALMDIEELGILSKMFNRVLITDIVRDEVKGDLPEWIEITNEYDRSSAHILSLSLVPGEASVIALAVERPGTILLIDESKGRLWAKRLGLRIIGTLGLIIKAKESGIIDTGKNIMDKLESHGFWMSETLKHDILIRLGEV